MLSKLKIKKDSAKKNAISDHLNLQKFYVEIDIYRYPRDSFLINYEEIDYIEQLINLKFVLMNISLNHQ